jgi:hypothetical protein
MDRREHEEASGPAEDRGVLTGCGKTIVSDLGIDNQHVRDYKGMPGRMLKKAVQQGRSE